MHSQGRAPTNSVQAPMDFWVRVHLKCAECPWCLCANHSILMNMITTYIPPPAKVSFPSALSFFLMGAVLVSSGFAWQGDGIGANDWASIRVAHNEVRHRAVQTPKGFRAENPGQGWGIDFDGHGFLVRPKAGDWSWGLQLQSFGYEGSHIFADEPCCVSGAGNRVTYSWGETVDEWFINDGRGLEHGYTLGQRLAGAEALGGPLVFELAVRGSLRAEVLTCGRGVRFVNEAGQVVLTYAGLRVFDSRGKDQHAVFLGGGKHLQLVIDEVDAHYPLTIDPVAQEAYLKASNTDPEDSFGQAVAISGDRIVIGAFLEDGSAPGVNGDESLNDLRFSGAAYVYGKIGGVWVQEAYLKASNPDHADNFGYSVAISGDRIVVGAYQEDSSATGVNGNEALSDASSSGAAYVFRKVGGSWVQVAYLKASNTDRNDCFGWSVAISGDRIVVGAVFEDSSAVGVDGDESLNDAQWAGAAYVFQETGGVWVQAAYLKASNTDNRDKFGTSVAISGDRIVVGAIEEDSSATGVNGDGLLNDFTSAGAAYVFREVGGAWIHEAYLKASNTDQVDYFGNSVAVSGDRVVVGAPFEDSSASGVNGDESLNDAGGAGAAYVFRQSGGAWAQVAYLKASNTDPSDFFGHSVAMSGDRLIVGARGEDSRATGANGNESLNDFSESGASYLFREVGGAWAQEEYLKASNTGVEDSFGFAVAISGDRALVGASREDSGATGVGGSETQNNAFNSGAAYVFELRAQAASYCSPAVPNSTGLPGNISMSGSTVVANNALTLHADGLPVGVFAFFLTSKGRDFVVMPGGSNGNLCLGGGQAIGRIHASLQAAGSNGAIQYLLDLNNIPAALGPVQVVPGEVRNFQSWYRDGGGMSNFTDAIAVPFE